MRILYIVPFVPWPIKVRSFNLIPRLARRHEVFLVCVSSAEPSIEQKEWLNRHCVRAVHVPHSTWKGMAQCVAALPTKTPMRMAYARSKAAQRAVQQMYDEAQPDVVYVERWRALEFLPKDLDVPVVCDPTDSMTLYNQRLMNAGAWWEKLVGWEEYIKFLRQEGKLALRANVTVFCSRVDLECVQQQVPEARCELVPNGVDCERYFFKQSSEEEPGLLVFTGSLKYRPNGHAVEFFLERIFPLVRREQPQAKFLAVGNGASAALARYRGTAGFEVLDFVPDLRPYLAKAAVVVAPLTVGVGVSNKLGEGFAVGTPVVASPLACGDLPVKSGNELLIGQDAQELAGHVITLLKDAGLRRQMAARARQFVERYDWEVVSKYMEELMQRVAAIAASESTEQSFTTAEMNPSET